MKKILYNRDNLKKEDITNNVVRVKALLINSNKEILLGFERQTFQFPGGHVEGEEDLINAIQREVKEETGITLEKKDLKPFFEIQYYVKDYPKKGSNSCYSIIYFIVYTDQMYNLKKTNYTDYEKEGNFELRYVPLDEVEEVLNESIEWNRVNKVIVSEMLEVLSEYKSNYMTTV